MPSDANEFEESFESMKEFVDDDGRHFYVIYFDDGSGLVFRKKQSEDEVSIAEFAVRVRYGKEAMRNIASATEFEFDDEMNTQQNFRKLINRE